MEAKDEQHYFKVVSPQRTYVSLIDKADVESFHIDIYIPGGSTPTYGFSMMTRSGTKYLILNHHQIDFPKAKLQKFGLHASQIAELYDAYKLLQQENEDALRENKKNAARWHDHSYKSASASSASSSVTSSTSASVLQ